MPPEEEVIDELKADLDELNRSEDEQIEDKKVAPIEDKEELKEEPKEEEEEVIEDKEEPLLHGRPTVKEITKEFPDLFKKFPDLRHAFFREQEYSAVFPTIEDAKEAQEKADSFDNLDKLITSGARDDFKLFLEAAEESKKGSIQNFAANFLPTLHSINQDLYFKITSPIIESVLRSAFAAGNTSKNEDLKNAAEHIAHFAFGDVGYATGHNKTEPIKTQAGDPELQLERAQFMNEKYTDMHERVVDIGAKYLVNSIKKDLDPNNVFNDWLKDRMTKDIFEEIDNALASDDEHMRNMNALWKRAQKAGFSGDWEDRLRSAYLSRARAVMPAIRARIRKEALAQKQRESDANLETGERSTNRREAGGSSQAPTNINGRGGKTPPAKSIDWSNTSDMDLLSGKVTLRK